MLLWIAGFVLIAFFVVVYLFRWLLAQGQIPSLDVLWTLNRVRTHRHSRRCAAPIARLTIVMESRRDSAKPGIVRILALVAPLHKWIGNRRAREAA